MTEIRKEGRQGVSGADIFGSLVVVVWTTEAAVKAEVKGRLRLSKMTAKNSIQKRKSPSKV